MSSLSNRSSGGTMSVAIGAVTDAAVSFVNAWSAVVLTIVGSSKVGFAFFLGLPLLLFGWDASGRGCKMTD